MDITTHKENMTNPRIIHGKLYKKILDDLSAKNIQLGIMLPMEHLEAIALKHANQQYEMMYQ